MYLFDAIITLIRSEEQVYGMHSFMEIFRKKWYVKTKKYYHFALLFSPK